MRDCPGQADDRATNAVVGSPAPRGGGTVIAAFDFDGTLTTGGSVVAFLVAVRGVVPVGVAILRSLPQLARGAVAGGASADRAKEELFMRLLHGLAADAVSQTASAFAKRHLSRRLRPEAKERLDWHRARGHRVVVVSASPECYVGPAAALLGSDAALATRLESDEGGRLTGCYLGKNCRGPEKRDRVAEWIRSQPAIGAVGAPVVWAYGNSRGDLALLRAADHGIDAGRLGRWGRLREFSRLRDASELPGHPISQERARHLRRLPRKKGAQL